MAASSAAELFDIGFSLVIGSSGYSGELGSTYRPWGRNSSRRMRILRHPIGSGGRGDPVAVLDQGHRGDPVDGEGPVLPAPLVAALQEPADQRHRLGAAPAAPAPGVDRA